MRRPITNSNNYTRFVVKKPSTLLPFIIEALSGVSRTRAKAILSGGGVMVNRKIEKQHDLALTPGMTVEISKRKPKEELRSKFVKVLYEDSAVIVIEKMPGILSMASAHHVFSVKTVLDEYPSAHTNAVRRT